MAIGRRSLKMTEIEFNADKKAIRKDLLEELLKEAMNFGGILPIRVLRNKLKEMESEE